MKKRFFLIGYMGAGKTTFGKILAKHKKMEFIDLDHYIETRYQKAIGQIFEELGEDEFRSIESTLLREIGDFEDVVISTGGGTPCFFDNMSYMNTLGTTIYLKSSADSLVKRLISCKNKRPLLQNKNEKELYDFISSTLNSRENYYNKAHIIFDVEDFISNEDAEKIVMNLIKKIDLH